MTNRYDVGIVAPFGTPHRKRRGKPIVCSSCGKGNVTLRKYDDGKYYCIKCRTGKHEWGAGGSRCF